MDAKVDIEQKYQVEEDKQFTICCSKSSVGFIKFSSAFIISIGILTFSFIMIGLHPERDNTIYFSLISAINTLFINPLNIQQAT